MYSAIFSLSVFGTLTSMVFLLADAATKSFEWNIAYTTANPDGKWNRQVIGVNGKWPPPPIELYEGERFVLKINNNLDGVNTGLHAHGLFQKDTNYFDGAVGVTQWYQLTYKSV